MFSSPVSLLLAFTAVAAVMHRVGVWLTLRFARSAAGLDEPAGELPGLTLLKPIKGDEEQLADNLRSFFEQQYPGPLQLVFCATEAGDPGMAVARAVAAEYPEADVSFVHSRDDFGLNPKVSNMHGGLLAARHDLVLQSDANVRIEPGYLRGVVAELLASDAALLGSLVVGVGERSLGAQLENTQLTAFTLPGVCTARELANIQCVLGKAMLFRRSELERIGGLARVKDVLAEDYVLAQVFEAEGRKVVVSPRTVQNINVDTPLERFFARHSRWLKMRAVVSIPGHVADLGSNPFPLSLLAWALSGFDGRLLLVALLVALHKAHCDAQLMRGVRGKSLGLAQLWVSPLRDLSLAALWLYSTLSRSTDWRGRRFLLGPGSVLIPNDGPLAVRLRRRLRLIRG